ncbi:hypothetical protein B2J93_1156 [Marssonina coronariae]|uniref:Uncharacterized protein n=1 Tax=Diplocarpon coronariae TaxID=2795749 RepID=A0A218YVF4_9HELO|nr:hypothetical protein B2J93_1156 [Marssonina coronariae]
MPIDRTSESTVQRSVGLDSEYPHTKTKRSWISSDCTQDSSRALAAADKLLNRGQITFAGDIRVRTTTRSASQFASVRVVYKDRNGAAGSTVSTAASATASGFDKTFTAGQSPIWATKFYGFSANIAATTSISSFAYLSPGSGGATTTYDNDGAGFSVQDSAIALAPHIYLGAGNGLASRSVTGTKSASSTGDSEPAGSLMPYTATPTQTARAFNATIGAEAYSGARPRRLDCELAPDFLLLKDGYGARDVRE